MQCRQELERLKAEYQQAVEQLAEKENEIYQQHETNMAAIELQRRQLNELRERYEKEKLDAWSEIDREKMSLEKSKAQGRHYHK
jgi:hypothetical protein